MKSLWDKASEYGSKAKGYLHGNENKEYKPDEMDKLNDKQEKSINEILKSYEDKIKNLCEQLETITKEKLETENNAKNLLEENESLTKELNTFKTNQEMSDLNFKRLKEDLTTKEQRLLLIEKEKTELNNEIIKIKEEKTYQNFIFNINDLDKKIEEALTSLKEINSAYKLTISQSDLEEIKEKLNTIKDKKAEGDQDQGSVQEPEQDGKEESETEDDKKNIIEEITKNLIAKYEEIIQIKSKELAEQENKIITSISDSLKDYIHENNKLIKEKLEEYSSKSESLLKENFSLSSELQNLKNELLDKNKKILNLESDIVSLTEGKTKIEEEFNNKIKLLNETSNSLKKNVNDLTAQLESKSNEHVEYTKNKENEISSLTSQLKTISDNYKKSLQTFKQFFLLLLEDDIFIDLIEKTFKSPDSESFFEDVYKLSKYIRPKLTFKIYTNILLDESLLSKISKYISDTTLPIKDYTGGLKSLSQLKISDSDEDNNFIATLISELISYIETLNSTINKQTKQIQEINSQLKSAKETLDESKKSDIEKYDLLNKHIAKLQQDCRENQKTEKMLRETIENLENSSGVLKTDNEKLLGKIKSLNNLYEELTKEKNTLLEKISTLDHQCELFKVENTELIEKNTQNENEIKKLENKNSNLGREKKDLTAKISEMEKLKKDLHEKINLLTSKENEINKLKSSYMELEEFIENLKNEKEHSNEMLKKQIFEMAAEIDNLKERNLHHEENLNSFAAQTNSKKVEELEKLLTDLEIENKHLKEQKEKMKKYSEEILNKVKNDLKDTEFLVDKRMISNILMKYFDTSSNEKLKFSMLDVLANFMGFTNDERKKIGLNQSSTAGLQNKTNERDDKLKSLSDDLYDFILNA